MECDSVRAQLTAFLDNELSPTEAQTLVAHLTSCADCAHEYAAMQSLYQQMGRGETQAESDETDLWPSLERTLLREEIVLLRETSGRMQAENAHLRLEVAVLRQQAIASRPLTAPVLFPTEAPPPNPKVWL